MPAQMLKVRPCVAVVFSLIMFAALNISASTPPFFRPPDYDSQWITLAPGESQTLAHNLGGDAGDYIVNLTLQPPGDHPSWANAMNRGAGGDTWHIGTTHLAEGVAWFALTDTEVTLRRYADDTLAGHARLRIWKTSNPDYDSGWFSLDPAQAMNLVLNLGGNPDNYLVDVRFADADINTTIGYHNIGEGGDQTFGAAAGATWSNLDADFIQVFRNPQDTLCDRVRVRIWANVSPTRTEGWEPWNAVPSRTHPVSLSAGGPWTDYVAVMDTRSPQTNTKPRNYSIGGDFISMDTAYGYYFDNFSHDEVDVVWLPGTTSNTDFRLRLFAYSAPGFDSGWQTSPPGDTITFGHPLSGDPDDYWIDLQFRGEPGSLGVNNAQFGGDTFDGLSHGGAWHKLGSQTVSILRLAGDSQTNEYRLRGWVAAPPDFDSGFMAIAPNQTLQFAPNLLANSAAWVIEVRQRSLDPLVGDHCFFIGGDNFREQGGALKQQGLALDLISGTAPNEIVEITRLPDDVRSEQVRLRVWMVFNEDYERFYRAFAPGEVYTINHDLGRNPDNYVVAMRFRTGSGAGSIQHMAGLGGDAVESEADAMGGAWGRLTPRDITFWRGPGDTLAEYLSVKIWSLGYPGAREASDHTLGRYTLPSTGGWRSQADHNADVALNVADVIAALNAGYE